MTKTKKKAVTKTQLNIEKIKKENLKLKHKVKALSSIIEKGPQLPAEIEKLRQSISAFLVAEQIRGEAFKEIYQWHSQNKYRP